MLQIRNLIKRFGEHAVFDGCSLSVNAGERVALIGPNGSGKTTLFRVILGEEPHEGGEVVLEKGARIGFLPQELDGLRGRTVLEEAVYYDPAVEEAQRRMAELTDAIARADAAGQGALLGEYDRVHSRFEQFGGYDLEHRAKKILKGLGFRERDFSRPTGEFSGGWRMRVALARILVAPPPLMLLDEPTNHLDLESTEWLQTYLTGAGGAVLFTSHDRAFIDAVATRIVEIDRGALAGYRGGYAAYEREKRRRREVLEAAQRNQQRVINETQRFIDRFRATASRAKLVQSRVKRLERMEVIDLPPERKEMRFSLPQPPRSGQVAVSLADVSKSYGSTRVYRSVSLALHRGERVALVGHNGAGKSTLLKILAGVLPVDAGKRTLGHNVVVGYYPQHRMELLDPGNTCFAEIAGVWRSGDRTEIQKLLGRFLFSGDDTEKPVSVLSGGEKSRLILAKILADPPNLLLLDEPVNHLDIPARDVLIAALEEFAGTLCFISHDLHFIRKIANRIVEVRNGRLTAYPGGYDYYVRKKALDAKAAAAVPAAAPPPEPSGVPAAPPKRTPPPRPPRPRPEAAGKGGSGRRMAAIEKEMGRVLGRIEELDRILSNPATYRGTEFPALARERKDLQRTADGLADEWESCAGTMEERNGDATNGAPR